jgi:hypothetical protein
VKRREAGAEGPDGEHPSGRAGQGPGESPWSRSEKPEGYRSGRAPIEEYSAKSHSALREKLISRGYAIIGEYSCAGFNTNSFLGFFGGLNKGRPNAEDLSRAEEFGRSLKGEVG